MQHRGRIVWSLLATLLTLMTQGCNEKTEDPVGNAAPPSPSTKPSQVSSDPTHPGRNRNVGVSLPEHNAFFAAMQSTMEETAQANSLTLDIQYADGQTDRQTQQVATFLQNKVDAILICPVDPQKSAAALQKANAAHVPIFTVHQRALQGEVAAHIGVDEELGGKLAARKIAEMLKEKGNVLLQEVPNDSNKDQAERAKGFQEEIAHHPALRLLHLWETHGQTIDAIFFVNDEAAAQDLSSLAPNKAAPPIIVGYGGEPNARAEIKKGQSYKADIGPNPIRMGESAIGALARSLRGEKTDPFVKVEPQVIDTSSVDKP